MSEFEPKPSELEQRLDEAGQLCRPRHPGWETLLARLPEQESAGSPLPFGSAHGKPPRGEGTNRAEPRGFHWRALVATAASILAVGVAFYFSSKLPDVTPPAVAMNVDIEVQRRGVQLTVFNPFLAQEPTLFMPLVAPAPFTPLRNEEDRQAQMVMQPNQAASRLFYGRPAPHFEGMALVRDQRLVLHLKAGDNLVRFTDVAASIDPTSVTLSSDTDPIDTKVIEQNFEFDLASGDALLKRYIDRKITCIGRSDDQGKSDGDSSGYLLSYDPGTIVLAERAPDADPEKPRPKTESISRSRLKAIRCDSMPKDLYTRPTLVWKLRTRQPGDHLTTFSYLCGNVSWQADYVAVIEKHDADRGDTLSLKGWVSMDNRSGTTYDNAGLKLIAGDVNRVRDPWAPVPLSMPMSHAAGRGGSSLEKSELRLSERKVITEKEFFEYKLYTLSQPSTIKDQQTKQLSLLEAQNVAAQRRYVYDPRVHATQATVELVVKNDKKNGLGRALPKGRVTLVQNDADGESQFLGRDKIDHTPKDEELKLKLGQAFEVVGESREVETRRPVPNELVQTSEFRVRNHKDEDINVRLVAHLGLYANWQVTAKTDDFTKHDFQTLYFDFRLKANTDKTIQYTVDYRW